MDDSCLKVESEVVTSSETPYDEFAADFGFDSGHPVRSGVLVELHPHEHLATHALIDL
jgi:hypothetical protein